MTFRNDSWSKTQNEVLEMAVHEQDRIHAREAADMSKNQSSFVNPFTRKRCPSSDNVPASPGNKPLLGFLNFGTSNAENSIPDGAPKHSDQLQEKTKEHSELVNSLSQQEDHSQEEPDAEIAFKEVSGVDSQRETGDNTIRPAADEQISKKTALFLPRVERVSRSDTASADAFVGSDETPIEHPGIHTSVAESHDSECPSTADTTEGDPSVKGQDAGEIFKSSMIHVGKFFSFAQGK
mmetsp:Transcript_5971/g.17257  ORF Transcript_5971/g.17257 Transcript_5971/m.17257 type:complete len:237 (-) Transcript_5971:26-736(-)